MSKDEALRLALRAMVVNNQARKYLADSGDVGNFEAEEQGYYQLNEQAITAVKAVLEAKDEPDKYAMDIECTKCGAKQSGVLTVHTTPPQRTWVEVEHVRFDGNKLIAKLKEKNT